MNHDSGSGLTGKYSKTLIEHMPKMILKIYGYKKYHADQLYYSQE